MEQLPNTVPSNLLDLKTVKAFMHSKAFWAENSNFEFSWQIQLQSWLHGVLSDSGGGGRDRYCGPRAGVGQAMGMYDRVKTEVAGHGSSSRL